MSHRCLQDEEMVDQAASLTISPAECLTCSHRLHWIRGLLAIDEAWDLDLYESAVQLPTSIDELVGSLTRTVSQSLGTWRAILEAGLTTVEDISSSCSVYMSPTAYCWSEVQPAVRGNSAIPGQSNDPAILEATTERDVFIKVSKTEHHVLVEMFGHPAAAPIPAIVICLPDGHSTTQYPEVIDVDDVLDTVDLKALVAVMSDRTILLLQ